MLCYHNELPELNHNEIIGWENIENLFDYLFIIWLEDKLDNQRIKLEQEITQNILKEKKVNQFTISMNENLFQDHS